VAKPKQKESFKMEIKRKVKKLTTLALALVLTLALLPAVPVQASGETVTMEHFTLTNVVKHVSVEAAFGSSHFFFVREGALFQQVELNLSEDNWSSFTVWSASGIADIQLNENFFNGVYSVGTISADDVYSSDMMTIAFVPYAESTPFHFDGWSQSNNFSRIEVPLQLNQHISFGFEVFDDNNNIVEVIRSTIIVIDEATAALITDGGDTPTNQAVPNLNTASNWAQEGITEAVGLGLVPQNLQAQYTQATTRAEFAALAVALYETITGRVITERATFNDSTDINVQKMGGLGVVQGVGGGNFNPNGTITREQAAVMLARLADAIGQPLPASAPTFADNAQLSSWAVDGVGQIQAAGIMTGVGNNNFAPASPYTREQSIVTMMRLYELLS